MHSLGTFQTALGEALAGEPKAMASWLETPAAARGLSVYRNTVTRGSIDVLVATFSTVVRLVGEAWFRAAAAVYVAHHPPTSPSLLHYGGDFARWLEGFEPAQDTPYLPPVAGLDRLWWDAYFASDAVALEPAALASLEADALHTTCLVLHPSIQLAAFDHNLASLWLAHRGDADVEGFDLIEAPEHLLIARSGIVVTAVLLDSAEYAFLSACQRGESLMVAAEQAQASDPAASLPNLIRAHLAAGRFTGLSAAKPGLDHDQ
jgi:hypothetical protein